MVLDTQNSTNRVVLEQTDSTLTTNQYTQKLPRNFWCPRNALHFCGIGGILLFQEKKKNSPI
jgi:hypothetical protein